MLSFYMKSLAFLFDILKCFTFDVESTKVIATETWPFSLAVTYYSMKLEGYEVGQSQVTTVHVAQTCNLL